MIQLARIPFLLAVFFLVACDDEPEPPPAPSARTITVLVEDDGIDPTLPAFAGKVTASYTLSCTSESEADGGVPIDPFSRAGARADDAGATEDAGADDAGVDDGLKVALLRQLGVPDERCSLIPGIAPVSAPQLAPLEPQRESWNRRVRTDVDVTMDPLLATLSANAGTGQYHGTSTASIIAHDNDAVRLVLVNRPLASAGDVAATIACPRQSDIDVAARLLADPDVVAAYRERPPASSERAFADTIATHGIAIVNESFGALSRHGIEEILFSARCFGRDLRAYFAALNELQRIDHLRAPTGKFLTVRAAGNESARLDEPDDGIDCRTDQPTVARVGSYGVTGERSGFTNFGECVDVFAPGEAVLGLVPGEWWLPQFGTSFAAPLVTRLVSMMIRAEGPFDPIAARQALHALRRPDRSIPRPKFPEELLYLPGTKTTLALTIEEPSPLRLTQAGWHRVWWPLRLVQRLRR